MCSSTLPYLDNVDAVLDNVHKVRAENRFILQFARKVYNSNHKLVWIYLSFKQTKNIPKYI